MSQSTGAPPAAPRLIEKTRYYERAGRLAPSLLRRYDRLLGEARGILDLGCGFGDLGRALGPSGRHVVGLDHDFFALRQASRHGSVILADLSAGALPFRDAVFDGVLAKDVVEHVPEPWSLLREVRRVLRSGGTLVVSIPMEFPWVVWNDYTHVRGFTAPAARLLVEDQGFEVRHVVPMGAVPLAGRLNMVDVIPKLLRLPGMRRLFGRSWEVLAVKA